MGEKPELLTVKQVARIFRVSKTTVYKWLRLGHLPKITLPSGTVRIPKCAVDDLITKGDATVVDRRDALVREIIGDALGDGRV